MHNQPPPKPVPVNRRFSVAPMMDYTDKHCRYFHRLLSRHCLLYTEMITTGALIHGDVERHLYLGSQEHPIAVQLGGSNPTELAHCAKLATIVGFDEINLNCGCPSDRVVSGSFGAIMMRQPQLVADCFDAMAQVSDTPITIKHRTGVDELDSYQYLCDFVGQVADRGCTTFIVHARKAWLEGLSPKQNREIPPLQYERVYQLKQDFPNLEIIINGGIKTLDESQQHLKQVDGVMMGREAYHNPYLLIDVDTAIFDAPCKKLTRLEIIDCFLPYMQQQIDQGARPNHLTRHILGLFHGEAGARKFRRHISENVHRDDVSPTLLNDAIALMQQSEETINGFKQA